MLPGQDEQFRCDPVHPVMWRLGQGTLKGTVLHPHLGHVAAASEFPGLHDTMANVTSPDSVPVRSIRH